MDAVPARVRDLGLPTERSVRVRQGKDALLPGAQPPLEEAPEAGMNPPEISLEDVSDYFLNREFGVVVFKNGVMIGMSIPFLAKVIQITTEKGEPRAVLFVENTSESFRGPEGTTPGTDPSQAN